MDPKPWWTELAIAACTPPFLPPRECGTCLRRGQQGPAITPLVDRHGACESALPAEDATMGLPW